MRLDERTLSILKNFASINQGIAIQPGNVIKTISTGNTILARATVQSTFDKPFAIFDLSRWLGVVSLFDEPEVELEDLHMTIREGHQKVRYSYAEESMIYTDGGRQVVMRNPEIQFSLKQEELQKLKKAQNALQLPEIAVIGNGETISIQAINTEKPDSDIYGIEVGETSDNFRMVFLAENLRVLPGDYDVAITSKGVSRFTTTDATSELIYYIAVESKTSRYGA
jgi:hypothetical protein